MGYYYVISGGEVLQRFLRFSDAWVFARLRDRYCVISHPFEGYWIVQPPTSN